MSLQLFRKAAGQDTTSDAQSIAVADDEHDEANDTLEELPPSRSLHVAEVGPQDNAGARHVAENAVEDFFGPDIQDFRITAETPLNRVPTRDSFLSAFSAFSNASYKTFLPQDGGYGGSLEHLCRLIDSYATLRNAEVVQSECYKQKATMGVLHRFLILELRRPDKKPIWVRLDRTRTETISDLDFALAATAIRANDVARLAPVKNDLIGFGKRENRQVFAVSPNLGDLHLLLHVICRELTLYKLWPENCWFFVSLIQQRLGELGNGRFTIGGLGSPNLAISTRNSIDRQLKLESSMAQAATADLHSRSQGVADTLPEEAILHFLSYALRRQQLNPVILERLANRSRGSFEWAATAYRYLAADSLAGAVMEDRLPQILDGPSPSPDALYQAILEQVSEGDSSIIIVALHGLFLGLEEARLLRFLLEIMPAGHFPPRTNLTALYRAVRHLRGIFFGNNKDGSHAMLEGYLGHQSRSGPFHVDIGGLRVLFAEGCINLMEQHLCFNIANVSTSFLPTRQVLHIERSIEKAISPLLSYCCQFWPLHAAHALGGGSSIPSLESFLGNRTLQWLEAMSLIQSSPETALLPLVKSQIALDFPTISALIGNVMQFAKTFATPISISTPHIYVSALTFAPEGSVFPSQRQSHLGIVRAIGLPTEWPCSLQILRGHAGEVLSLAFSHDGARVTLGFRDASDCSWTVQTGAAIQPPPIAHSGDVGTVLPSGSAQIASGSGDKIVRSPDEQANAPGATPTWLVRRTLAMAISPDGARVVQVSSDNTLRIRNARTGAAIGQPMFGHSDRVNCVTFSLDGKHIASGSSDKTVRLWDAQTGAAIGQPLGANGHSSSVFAVAFSPDGLRIASASDDRTIRLWYAPKGVTSGNLKVQVGRDYWATSIAYSPDGTRIAAGMSDKTIRLWNVHSGAAIGKPLAGHFDWVRSIAFSPDGTRIASGSDDGTVCLWDTSMIEGKQGSNQHAAEPSLSAIAADGSLNQSVAWSPDPSVGGSSISGTELERYSPQRAASGELILRDGWVVGPADELLLWVPSAHRKLVQGGGDTYAKRSKNQYFTIDPAIALDFRFFKCGTEWTQCRSSGTQ